MSENFFKCDSCEKSYSTKKNLYRHVESIHDGIKYQCDICDKMYSEAERLKRHFLARHNLSAAKFVCNICGITMDCRSELKNHMDFVHKKIKNFKCWDICGKQCARKQDY